MTDAQRITIEEICRRLTMGTGTFRDLLAKTFPGHACGLRSTDELSQYQAGALIGKLREIEAGQHKPEAATA